MTTDLRTPRARRARALAEALQRRRLRKPAVQITAFALGVVSVAINSNLLLQGIDYLLDASGVVGRFTLLTLQTAYRQRLFWGFLLPGVLGAGWLTSLLIIGRAYAGYALHRRWWESQTARPRSRGCRRDRATWCCCRGFCWLPPSRAEPAC